MDKSILKEILNNVTLLRWVRKFSANNLLEDNKKAESFELSAGENSVSIMDKTATKLLVTNSTFEGKVLVKFNLEQLNDLIECVGKKGELIIPDTKNREMVAQIGTDIVIVCPLPVKDKSKK